MLRSYRYPRSVAATVSPRLRRLSLIVLTLALLPAIGPVRAEQLTSPVLVATSGSDGPTLGIPRWKAYISESSPSNCWIGIANSGSSSNNLSYSLNSGTSWSTGTIVIDGYLDYHLSLYGEDGHLNFTFPGLETICFRRFYSPAQSDDDGGPLVKLSGTTPNHRSSIMVDANKRIWIFTRRGGVAAENVRYFYSANEGTNWTSGVAWATGAPDVRIGSMPFIDGRPALIVLHLEDARGFEYYLWNGSSFEAKNDHSIYAANMGYVRAFTHNVINDTTMHLVFGLGADLIHVWKNHNGGSGAWNTGTIESSSFTTDNEWYPISTVHGDNLYLFYCRKTSDDASSSMIYYRRWSQLTRTWSDAELVSTLAANVANRDPNTCFQVPAAADYIPVFWTSGSGTKNVYYSRIDVAAVADTVAPGKVHDLGSDVLGTSEAPTPN